MKPTLCLSLDQITAVAVKSYARWAVSLDFNPDLYEKIFPGKTRGQGQDELFALFTDDYVQLFESNPELHVNLVYVSYGARSLFLFDSEDDAMAFFKRVPEGHIVNAEVWEPNGEYFTDNT